MRKLLYFIICLLLFTNPLHAKIKLPRIVSDGMVLQRNQPLSIWGWADAGENVTVNFKNKIYHTIAGKDKKWLVKIEPQPDGGPYRMSIIGKNNKIDLQDLLIGDVWLCSGQSNMEAVMGRTNIKANYKDIIATSNYKKIRQFTVQRDMAFQEIDDVKSEKAWVSVNPESVLSFSAVAFFFAKELYEKYKVPIGLINSSVGGTPVQSWVDYQSLKNFPAYDKVALKFQDTATLTKTLIDHQLATKSWYKSVEEDDLGLKEKWFQEAYIPQKDWNEISNLIAYNTVNSTLKYGTVWFTTDFEIPAEMEGKPAKISLGMMHTEDETFLNGEKIGSINSGYTNRDYMIKSGILKSGKNRITFRLKSPTTGISFDPKSTYQLRFENDSIALNKPWKYRTGIEKELLPKGNGLSLHSPTVYYYSMIKPLSNFSIKGVLWYQGESNVSKPEEYQALLSSLIKVWRKDWQQPNLPFLYVQLANYSSTGKEPAISNWALLREAQLKTLQVPYTAMAVIHDIGEKDDIHPRNKQDVGKRLALAARKVAYQENLVFSGPIYKSMRIKGEKIYLSFNHIGAGLKAKGESLNGFTLSADGKIFTTAQAKIVGNEVVVWSNTIQKPRAVRYAWADSPDGANLYNLENLPASSFKSN